MTEPGPRENDWDDATIHGEIFGTVIPEPTPRTVVAGELSCLVAGGVFRTICWRGVEVVRGLACLVRDPDWGTCPEENVREEWRELEDTLHYSRSFTLTGGDLEGFMSAVMDPAGSIAATVELRAAREFWTNRAGFVILHPIRGLAGAPLTVHHSDGAVEQTHFPAEISPDQPVFDITGLEYEISGVSIVIEFEGERLEMEDQRNWTDASFKSYCRSLLLPFPYRLAAGVTARQSVRFRFSGVPKAPELSATSTTLAFSTLLPSGDSVQFGDPVDVRSPEILVALERNWMGPGWQNAGSLVRPSGWLVRLDPEDTGAEPWIQQLALHSASDGGGEGPSLELEVVIPEGVEPQTHLRQIATTLATVGVSPRSLIALPEPYLKSYQPFGAWPEGVTPNECVKIAREQFRPLFPEVQIGAGMLTYFTELNRCPPALQEGDYVTHGTAAIIHAADDRSVLATLEALPDVFRSARRLAGDRPVRLGLVSIGARTNPYGKSVAPNPNRERVPMAQEDPRQYGLFAATFAIGAASTAALAGCQAIALSSLTGPFGVVGSGPEAPFTPLFSVVRTLAQFQGYPVVPIIGLPPGVYALAVRHEDGSLRIVLANATLETRAVQFAQPVTLLEFRSPGAALEARDIRQLRRIQTRKIELGPCGVAFLSAFTN